MMKSFDPAAVNTANARKLHRPLLTFNQSEGRLRGMPVLALLYPSTYLALRFDPLRLMTEQPTGATLTAEEAIGLIEAHMAPELDELTALTPQDGPIDEAWYWAAPVLLDRRNNRAGTIAWRTNEQLPQQWAHGVTEDAGSDDRDDSVWGQHVGEARRLIAGNITLGRPPEDLARVVALLAVGRLGVVALRALSRVSGGPAVLADGRRRHAAGRIAWAVRSLFNGPDVMAMLRGLKSTKPYWRQVLDYCVQGCLQASLDEYAHVLGEPLAASGVEPHQMAVQISSVMVETISMRVASPSVDRIRLNDQEQTVDIEPHRFRARFAMRYGDEKSDDGISTVSRADQVRQAFNSPFWPFVLATTSVGQEGLDFHTYCHAVMHWNLPTNPVDLEQREGRVHRYKGHAVRRNVASVYRAKLCGNTADDPWQAMFTLAGADHGKATGGLKPYWVFAPAGGVAIERHVPALPLSIEAAYLPALRQSLAVYRTVFGQPRQDDLVDYLTKTLGMLTSGSSHEFGIDLSPALPNTAGLQIA